MGRDYDLEKPLYHETVEKVTHYGKYLIEMITYHDGASYITIYDNKKRGWFSSPKLLMHRKMKRYANWGTKLKSMLFELEYDQYQMNEIETDDGYIDIDYEYEAKKRRSKASQEPPPVQEEEPMSTVSNKPEEIKFYTSSDWQTSEITYTPANAAAKLYLKLNGNPKEAEKFVILGGQIRKKEINNLKQFQKNIS